LRTYLLTSALLLLSSLTVRAQAPAKLIPVDETAVRKLIASSKGNVVLLNFWATWCVPCRQELPQLAALESRLRPKGVKLILISADEEDAAAKALKFLESKKLSTPAYRKAAKNDEQFIDAIDSKWSGALPALFLYDRNGKRVQSFIGETEIPVLEAAIRKLL
jgi:thiol-disulfide isomerase/thioredoxin